MRTLIAGVLLLAAVVSTAQSPGTTPPDYTRVRRSIAERPDYNPYTLQALEKALSEESRALWKKGQHAEATNKARELIDAYPASPVGHRMMRDIYEAVAGAARNPAQREHIIRVHEWHKAYMTGVLDSILASGDGRSTATAYWVITISEEYFLLRALGYSIKERKTVETGGKRFDAFTAVDRDGKERPFYFDVTHFPRRAPK